VLSGTVTDQCSRLYWQRKSLILLPEHNKKTPSMDSGNALTRVFNTRGYYDAARQIISAALRPDYSCFVLPSRSHSKKGPPKQAG